MAIYKVLCEGQTIDVPEDIGKFDERVRAALAPYYPEVGNALITRSEKDGVVTVSVVKKAGSKGSSGVQYLVECAGGKNPAIGLYEEIQAQQGRYLDVYELASLDGRIEQAIEQGQVQARQVTNAAVRLRNARAIPAKTLVAGF